MYIVKQTISVYSVQRHDSHVNPNVEMMNARACLEGGEACNLRVIIVLT